MRIHSLGVRVAIAAVATGLVLSGCSRSDDPAPGADVAALGTSNDINPRDVSELRDGGNLRLALSSFPEQWNALHIDSDGEVSAVERPLMPRAFHTSASGELSVNTDYFTSVELTGTDPQRVVYTINPEAVWSDGTPITWEDMRSQAAALSGANPEYLIKMTFGFDRVEKVERGVDDRQAIITFKEHYADWQGQFAGEAFLYPASVTGTPEAFNKSQLESLGLSAGPFIIQSVDRAQGRFVLGRNPKWWGDTPKLDTITFTVLASEAVIPALQNNEIDAVGIASIDDMRTAQSTPGVEIRRAPGNSWSHLTFNGAPGSILEDPRVRVAISKAIDRKGIAVAMQNGLVANPEPLNNHVYVQGQIGYQDNSLPFDPEAAARELDELGWKLNGEFREKDGRRLVIRDVMYNAQSWVQIAQIIQQNLAQIGVELVIDTRPGQGLFTDVFQPGDFDAGQWVWSSDVFALKNLPQVYRYDPNDLQGNYGRIGSAEINDLIDKALAELDPKKAIDIANEIDRKLFEIGFSLPLVQSAGNVAVRADLANYGAPGLASYDYTKIGFVK
ncbi:ABC transporter family substrate-binding protein [Nocardia cyriacigeorgica]|uniref:ABC transporter family substrate-binding protein n=1 Tax=Nocardia cyriacigeorgica TaxID=135487 RepID=A0A6P1D4N4_9NOCA|nr:ABC transporter family substrate-binding protein [Nocardia cyriacigeorgica]NEW38269.1 ABC transporter family substrate-binding protein [Nocardia cyriacigeorgica]NEW44384.1 ABC transporter family substrate-binding protein [Nocardia cyriacigeorgica]NEW49212.1 ABC transporter family substrate-binding protein [Nocardia cyriacigeorgica]NEW57499.1 ABC transporter family substrate-binding protein [Nocardia cyriacigeorgica]